MPPKRLTVVTKTEPKQRPKPSHPFYKKTLKALSKTVQDARRALDHASFTVLNITHYHDRKTVLPGDVELARNLFNVPHGQDVKLLPDSKLREVSNVFLDGVRFGEKSLKDLSKLVSDVLQYGVRPSFTTTVSVSFESYLRVILKQVAPDLGMTASAMSEINDKLSAYGSLISFIASTLASSSKGKTITSRHVQTAVRMAISAETLRLHAVEEGSKAVRRFTSSDGETRTTAASRSGITFPPSRARKILSAFWKDRLSDTASVYLASVLEYLAAEILEAAGKKVQKAKRVLVTPKFIQQAIRDDEDLSALETDGASSSSV